MGLRNKIWLVVLLLICTSEIRAQSIENVFAQKYAVYNSYWPEPKLHLIFNQEKYAPGDTIFFKAYFLNGNLTSIQGRQTIDLNLFDSQGVIINHLKFSVYNGVGANQLVLSDSVSAGSYLISARHSWMLNFPTDPVFTKNLIVVDKNRIEIDPTNVISLAIEGGSLIHNVNSKVCFKAMSESVISIWDNQGVEVGNTQIDATGYGSVEFIPNQNLSYTAKIASNSQSIPLPSVNKDGCILRLMSGKDEEPRMLLIQSGTNSQWLGKDLVLILTSKGQVLASKMIKLDAAGKLDVLLASSLPTGLIQASLLSSEGQILSFREFYQKDSKPTQVELSTNKSQYEIREKLTLDISLRNAEGNPIQGEYSINMLNDALFEQNTKNSLADELGIFNLRKEKFEINRSQNDWQASLDNYLVIHPAMIDWNKILSSDLIKPRYSFNRMSQKNGFAYFTSTGEAVPAGSKIMFYLQKSNWRFQTEVAENGNVGLTVPEMYGDDEIFWIAQSKYGEKLPEIIIDWADSQQNLKLKAAGFKFSDEIDPYANFSKNHKLINKSYGFFTALNDQFPEPKRQNTKELEWEIGGADVTVDVQKYITFPTMEELIKEVIKTLYVGSRKHKKIIRVRYLTNGAKDDPLYIIDGIATSNTDFFLSLKPEDVLKVKLITAPLKLLHFGILGENGIVIVETKPGTIREPLIDESRLIEGINEPIPFHSISYNEVGDNHIPDFRSTIYWNPQIITDENGQARVEFYCSDDVGTMTIRIDGLIQNGKAFTKEIKINVGLEKSE